MNLEIVGAMPPKERGKGKETFPPATPYREKGSQKEISASPSPYPSPKPSPLPSVREEGKGEVDLHQLAERTGKAVRVDADLILNSPFDPVQIALNVLRIPSVAEDAGVRYNNARIMRHLLRIIGEEAFRDATYRQWRENAIDGEPRSRARTFMAKLNAIRAALSPKGGAE